MGETDVIYKPCLHCGEPVKFEERIVRGFSGYPMIGICEKCFCKFALCDKNATEKNVVYPMVDNVIQFEPKPSGRVSLPLPPGCIKVSNKEMRQLCAKLYGMDEILDDEKDFYLDFRLDDKGQLELPMPDLRPKGEHVYGFKEAVT